KSSGISSQSSQAGEDSGSRASYGSSGAGSQSTQSTSQSSSRQSSDRMASERMTSEGASTSAGSGASTANSSQSLRSNAGNDIIRDTLVNAVGTMMQTFEPQINDFSARMAHQAVDRSKDLAATAYSRVQKQPWYLVGIAAFLLVGAAVMIGFGGEAAEEPTLSH
ncbi:MAG: hypothetical protein V4692_12580, partial [Bdellovibrionota bacterium]